MNDVQIESQVLVHGDAIRLDTFEMRFIATDQEFTRVEALQMLTMHGLLINLDPTQVDHHAPTAPGEPVRR